jgi:hypothetical protein
MSQKAGKDNRDKTPNNFHYNRPSSARTTWLVPTEPTQIRTWHDRLCGWSVEAEFQGTENSRIFLRKADGTKIEFPTEKISQQDWSYILAVSTRLVEDDPQASETESTVKSKAKGHGSIKARLFKWLSSFRKAARDDDDSTIYTPVSEGERVNKSKLGIMDEHTLKGLGLKEHDASQTMKAIQNQCWPSSTTLAEPALMSATITNK